LLRPTKPVSRKRVEFPRVRRIKEGNTCVVALEGISAMFAAKRALSSGVAVFPPGSMDYPSGGESEEG